MHVQHINELSEAEAVAELRRCCGSSRWVQEMVTSRPFSDADAMFACADEIWWRLSRADWLEAFSHHPQIGADVESLRLKFAATATWSAGEQAGVAAAREEVLQALACGNRDYEEKFGYIFIVCASGKTAAQMLEILQSRLPNAADVELRIAAGEQSKITRIRLEKLCQEAQSQPTC